MDDMFQSYEFNDDEKWVIPDDGLHMIVDTYITQDMLEDDVIALVNIYGVFKAIKLYQDTYGDFELDDFSFNHTYGRLAYVIFDDYINQNELIIEEEEEEVDCVKAQIG